MGPKQSEFQELFIVGEEYNGIKIRYSIDKSLIVKGKPSQIIHNGEIRSLDTLLNLRECFPDMPFELQNLPDNNPLESFKYEVKETSEEDLQDVRTIFIPTPSKKYKCIKKYYM